MFHLNLRMQAIGLSLLNQWCDVHKIAFLYNLIQQLVPELRPSWPDMETFIKIHGEIHIFNGTRPKDASQSLDRLEPPPAYPYSPDPPATLETLAGTVPKARIPELWSRQPKQSTCFGNDTSLTSLLPKASPARTLTSS